MENSKNEDNRGLTDKYITILSTISNIEMRLGWMGPIFLALNIGVFFFVVNYVTSAIHKYNYAVTAIELSFILFSLVIGMAVSSFWAAHAIRLQLKLKLRYFQARYLERKMNCVGECLLSDEALFFDPSIRRIESPDDKETLYYPSRGFTRMDGFIGAAKPGHFSLLLPCTFFAIYWIITIWIIYGTFTRGYF